MGIDLVYDNIDDEQGLGWVVTAAVAATSIASKLFGGRNQAKTAEADARLANNTARLNKNYSLELNKQKRAEAQIKQTEIEINKLEVENDGIVAATGKLLEAKKVQTKQKKTKSNTTKIAVGVVGLVILTAVAYKMRKNK